MQRSKIAVIYPFYAHYRSAVIEELRRSTQYEYIFYGDAADPSPGRIRAYAMDGAPDFIRTPCLMFKSRYLLQKGILQAAVRTDIHAIIYLGDVQYITTWLSAALARATGKQVLFWTHGWIRDDAGLKDAVRTCFYRICHSLLLYGNRAKRIGIKKGFDPAVLYVIYNSIQSPCRTSEHMIDGEQIMRTRRNLFDDPSLPLVIFSGRLVKAACLELLIKALSQMAVEGHRVNFLVVGEGPEKESLRQLTHISGLSCNFVGACYHEERLAEYFTAANVTVAPGKAGLIAIQSLSYGTPVITHDNYDRHMPEAESIVPGVNGGLYKYQDSLDLARVIAEWTKDSLPNGHIRRNCRKSVERCYNPHYQRKIIEEAILKIPAADRCNGSVVL